MTEEEIDKEAKTLFEAGRAIEAGWTMIMLRAVPPTASKAQVDCMRHAFFRGVWYLHQMMSNIAKEADEGRVSQENSNSLWVGIAAEIEQFADAELARQGKTTKH